jgi:hypothetical protein
MSSNWLAALSLLSGHYPAAATVLIFLTVELYISERCRVLKLVTLVVVFGYNKIIEFCLKLNTLVVTVYRACRISKESQAYRSRPGIL